jgi:hypothetical protein
MTGLRQLVEFEIAVTWNGCDLAPNTRRAAARQAAPARLVPYAGIAASGCR